MPKLYDEIAEIRRRVQSYVWTLNDLQELLEDPRHASSHNVDWAVSDTRSLKHRQAAIVEDLSALLPLLLRLSEHQHDIDLAWAPADGEAPSELAGEPADRDTTAVLDLGFRLVRHLAARSAGQNVFISPVGIMLALGMLASGARGETAQAAVATLGMGVNRTNALAARLMADAASSAPGAAIRIANGVWHHRGLTVDAAYAEALRSHYDAVVRGLDYDDPSALTSVNAWASQATFGLIPHVLASLDRSTPLYLVNTTAFDGTWTEPFSPQETTPAPFTRADGSRLTVPMMSQKEWHQYVETERFQMVRRPYGAGQVAMYVILPEEHADLDDLLAHLTPANWCAWLETLHEQEGTLKMPRFRADSRTSLLPALAAIGPGAALSDPVADLSGIAEGLRGPILDAVHTGVVEVDEAGTRAAAATTFHTGGRGPARFLMTVDRPFCIVIRDERSGMPLFVGTISEPAALGRG